MGVEVNIKSLPPPPLSNFIIICISVLASWRSSSHQQPFYTYATRQFAGSCWTLIFDWKFEIRWIWRIAICLCECFYILVVISIKPLKIMNSLTVSCCPDCSQDKKNATKIFLRTNGSIVIDVFQYISTPLNALTTSASVVMGDEDVDKEQKVDIENRINLESASEWSLLWRFWKLRTSRTT